MERGPYISGLLFESSVHFLQRTVENREVAQELAQEVFLRVSCTRVRYQATARFTSWLYRIAANLAFNWLRRRGRERQPDSPEAVRRRGLAPQPADGQPTVEQELVRRTVRAEVRRAVAALPYRRRAVVLLHKYHGLSYQQIAQAPGCSVQAVQSLTFRAYANLRRALGQPGVRPAGRAEGPFTPPWRRPR